LGLVLVVEERLDCACKYRVEPERGMESGFGATKDDVEEEWVMEEEEGEWVEGREDVVVNPSERKEPRSMETLSASAKISLIFWEMKVLCD
jgi:hypothetical protein